MTRVHYGLLLAGCSGWLLASAGTLSEATAAAAAPDWQTINPVTRLTADTFVHPPASDLPWVRLNMPASADPAELMSEVSELHRSGIGGIEVGQGAFPNDEQLIALLTRANALGVKISLSHGPTQYPADYSIDDDHARKTLAFGNVTLAAGERFDGALPSPRPPPPLHFRVPAGKNAGMPLVLPTPPAPKVRNTLIAVLAYRCSSEPCKADGVSVLDATSVMDLTRQVTDTNALGIDGGSTAGSLHWTPPPGPAGVRWQLIAFWSHGVFAQPDLFSAEGLAQLEESLEQGLSAKVRALMRINGGDIFYDSHTADRGSPDELWTNRMPQEFQQRAGYALLPKLAALFPEAFDFSDGSAPRVRNDLYAVRGNLWIETQLNPLRQWAHTLSYSLRVQPEGEMSPLIPISDQVKVTSVLDRPEHESLFTNDEVDNYLPIASANHMTGNTWYSTECCAALNMNYAQSLQDMTIRMHRSFAGGITKLVYHVYPYRDAANARWPGYHNFGQAGFSNAWGPRDPDWIDARTYNEYFARMAEVLTQGRAGVDVAVFMQNYLYPQPQMIEDGSGFRIWRDTQLQEAGFTRDYLDPELLARSNAIVTGQRLAPDGPAYKALIIDGELQPSSDPDKHAMPLASARRILEYARAGLPIIIVAAAPDHVPGLAPVEDRELAEVMALLLKEPAVHPVIHEADVPGELISLGIRPSAQPAAPSPLLSVHRRSSDGKSDYYYLYNESVVSPKGEPANLFEAGDGKPLHTEIALEGHGQPYLLNAWSGKVTPISGWRIEGERIVVELDLAADDAAVIALSASSEFLGARSPDVQTKQTPSASIRSRPAIVLPQIDLTSQPWQLTVQDWQPAHPYATTFGLEAVDTPRPAIHLDLAALKSWPEIPQLQHASGVGEYRATITLPRSWSAADGATLELGQVFDSFQVKVNGQSVAFDQLHAMAEVGPLLKPGVNRLVIRVATTLNNRLEAIDEDVHARGLIQPYGLIGPVILRPYHTPVDHRGHSPSSAAQRTH